MLPEAWQDFIAKQGGEFNANSEVEFKSATNVSDFISDLSYLGVIEVSGEDKIGFLQGQLTSDIQKLAADTSQFAGYCTPKGRMLALFRIIPVEDKFLLLLPQELLPSIAKRLQMYVLMSKVSITDMSTDLSRIGICGQQALEKLVKQGYQVPDTVNGVTQHDGIIFVRVADNTPRFIAIGESEKVSMLWDKLSLSANSTKNWKLKDIQAGLPQVYGSTSEAFIPQMQNLQALDGISFKKGCYTGQEVVARMQYLGKLKRQMYLLEIDGNTLPEAGDNLYSPTSSSGQGAGKIVDAQYNTETQKAQLLAVLEISSAENNNIYLDEANTFKAEIVSLPYALENK